MLYEYHTDLSRKLNELSDKEERGDNSGLDRIY